MNRSSSTAPKRGAPKQAVTVLDVSPVALARDIPAATRLALVARAAGRCEFRGCNEFLYEHPLTSEVGNFAENAHIVAFRESGPRGTEGERPVNINGDDNLILLCQPCHKNIDDHPRQYPRAELMAHKREHEARVRFMTSLGPELRTNVVTLKSRIGERVVEISMPEIVEALRPRYPASAHHKVIDLTQLGDETDDGYYPIATRLLRQQTREIYAAGGPLDFIKHLSVFGLAPIPLLVSLGHALSNTVPTDFFQAHRDRPERWRWYEGEPVAAFSTSAIQVGTAQDKVAVILSLSGTIAVGLLPVEIDADFSIYAMTLAGSEPNPGFLRQREDFERFRSAYRELLAHITRCHPTASVVHLFPAVPAPVAISCGFDLLPKVHPALAVYDFDKRVGGFKERTRVDFDDR